MFGYIIISADKYDLNEEKIKFKFHDLFDITFDQSIYLIQSTI